VVLMQRGAKSMPTITAVKQQLDDINDSGCCRRACIWNASTTARSDQPHHLDRDREHGGGHRLIFLLQWLFLGNLRSAFIVAMTIPFALSFAVLIIVLQGNRPICSRWARWTSAWWSMRRSSWWRTSSAIWSNDPSM
jgi:cobalt-zinc-cadmium resistance protein CzcA